MNGPVYRLVGAVAAIGLLFQGLAAKPPNILFIMSDDHAAAAWGIYPSRLNPFVVAPNIDRLAREGCRVDRAYATNALCGPSRASILTGLYSHLNGVRTNADALDPALPTVPSWLGQSGYATALIGKWHLKSRPSGFDHYSVLPGQGRYHDPILRTAEDWEAGGNAHPGFSADVITAQAIAWLEARTEERPFFMMCHYKAPHEPFGYPERYADWLADVTLPFPESLHDHGPVPEGRTFTGQTLDVLAERFHAHPERYQLQAFPEPASTQEARERAYQEMTRNFLRSVRAIDDNIGRLITFLESTGQLDNTVVIYTTDQGYFLGEHGFFDKRIMYEEAIRMPMVIRYPEEIRAGSVCHDLILNVDLPALFLDFAGVEAPVSLQGRSFRAQLRGERSADWREAIYYRYWTHMADRPAHYGIRTENHKLIYFYGQPLGLEGTDPLPTAPTWELYDLQADPLERHNLYDDTAHTAVQHDLLRRLQSLQKTVGDTPVDP